ncbi:alpha/beta hydrolase [Haloarculaceae archaeon H-GB1-1]|nr:alpha/beta hydrolase [Haloarculaceae archaeon H-GB1-1]
MRKPNRGLLAGAVGLAVGATGVGLWRWKRELLGDLEAGSELVTTEEGVVEVARRGSGEPILVLHGTPGGYDQALAVAEPFFDDGYELIAPSRPGYLRTPLVGDGSPGEQATLYAALLDELDVESALVVGVSGGGPAALQFAADYPDRVSGVVLASAVVTASDDRTYGVGNRALDAVLTSRPALDAQSGLVAALHRFSSDRLVGWTHEGMSTLDGDALDEYVAFVRTHPDHRLRSLDLVASMLPGTARLDGVEADEYWLRRLPVVDFAAVDCPVLAVHGEYDAMVPMDHAEYAVERLPDADLLRAAADHLVWVGPDADRTVERVREFAETVLSPTEPTNP